MNAAHTPGPWVAVEIGQGGPADAPMPIYEIHSADGRAVIAEYVDGKNAPALSAVPELLEALQLASNVLFLLSDEVKALGLRAENVPEKVRAAILRATGEST